MAVQQRSQAGRIYTNRDSRAYNSINTEMLPRMTIRVKGTTGLIIAAAIVVAVGIAYPPYWIVLGICVGIGLVVALILYLRNKYSPIRDEDVDNNKRPLGLD